MGLELFGAFVAAGLAEPELRSEQDVGGGAAWAGYAVLAETVRSLLPAIEATGLATAAEVDPDTLADRLRADVVATGGVAASPRSSEPGRACGDGLHRGHRRADERGSLRARPGGRAGSAEGRGARGGAGRRATAATRRAFAGASTATSRAR